MQRIPWRSRIKLVFLGLVTALCLAGCMMHRAPVSDASQPQTSSCEQRCLKRMLQCQRVCRDGCLSCELHEKKAEKAYYQAYYRERGVQGKNVIRQLQSYRDPLQCRKVSCDCAADYRVCHEACAGEIHKRLGITPFCC